MLADERSNGCGSCCYDIGDGAIVFVDVKDRWMASAGDGISTRGVWIEVMTSFLWLYKVVVGWWAMQADPLYGFLQ